MRRRTARVRAAVATADTPLQERRSLHPLGCSGKAFPAGPAARPARRDSRTATAVLCLADFTGMALCLSLIETPPAPWAQTPFTMSAFRILLPALAFVLLLFLGGMYERNAWVPLPSRGARALLAALVLPMPLASAGMPPATAALASLSALGVSLATRHLAAVSSLWRPKGPDRELHILVAGSNERTETVVRAALNDPKKRCKVLGLVDDRAMRATSPDIRQFRLVSDIESLPEFLRRNVVDEVIIGMPLRSMYDRAQTILGHCMDQGIRVSLLEDCPAQAPGHPKELSPHAITRPVYAPTLNYGQTLSKRAMDLALCIPLILLTTPLALLTALTIKLTSKGPVLFVQNRVGLGKRLFRFYKFRTMIPDAQALQPALEHANEADGGAFKIRNDPRLTPVGRILRKYSIDELPQLFNVLRGDMSLVGPRPLPMRDLERMEKNWACTRFTVLPGLSCLWQVSGRLEVPFDEWMRLDMEYIARWSLLLDLKILLRTIPAVCSGRGAY